MPRARALTNTSSETDQNRHELIASVSVDGNCTKANRIERRRARVRRPVGGGCGVCIFGGMTTNHGTTKIASTPWRRTIGIAGALGLLACGPVPTTVPSRTARESGALDATAKFAQVAAAVTGQKAKLADEYEKGRHIGFDTYKYPGARIMKIWKDTPGSPYKWVGVYLPAPCHAGRTWVGKRQELDTLGWGIAIVYVGQQTWGRTPRPITTEQQDALRKRDPCATDLLTASEGRRDADDAVAVASAEGYAKGVVVFLDIERMEKIPQGMKDYYTAWTERMLELGQYRPGVYTHRHNAEEIFADVSAAFKKAGLKETPRFWIAGGQGFREGRAPQDVGFAFAGVWQGLLDVARSVAQVKLPIDVNVASWASPSETGFTE